MEYRIKDKATLNKVTHSVRAAQAVLQYSVGAMVDFPDQTLITAAPETWSRTERIYDDRFAKALGIDNFALPTRISYSRFPEWYFCPKCRRFQTIREWISEYHRLASKKIIKFDQYMTKNMRCFNSDPKYKCKGQDLVVARIVTVCEDGHINDFPWVNWVHKQSKKQLCGNPLLSFKTGASGTEGLEGLSVSCSCGAFTTLKGAFEADCFEKLDNGADEDIFRCEGNHPHKNIKEKCVLYPRTVQRGSSSVYFPLIYSSLVIPPYADKLNSRIEKSGAFAECEATLSKLPEMREMILEQHFSKWVGEIAQEIGTPRAGVESVLQRKWFNEGSAEVDVTSVKYRAEEYEALSGEISTPLGSLGDFSREGIRRELFRNELPHIKAVSLIDKVRVVNALIGFSRLTPVSSKDDDGFVHIKEQATRWYPAYEVRGEGIFIEFEQAKIDNWIAENPVVADRAKKINDSYANSFSGENHPRIITPKFILLHTISHLLIKQLSFECGYSIANLNERLYCADEDDGKQMAGIFIYTASGDSEGTLGGLVRQGKPDMFPKIFKRAIESAKTCSNDPVCILSHGQGRDSLNLAACHACALLPETCCEERNSFLDRGTVVGTYENSHIGFYNKSKEHIPCKDMGAPKFLPKHEYTKKDIYKILGVPSNLQGGNWDTGYNRYQDDYFIFANIDTHGRTGHDYSNRIDNGLIYWSAKSRTTIQQSQMQGLAKPKGSIYFFHRENNLKPWIFAGKVVPKEVHDTSPVQIIWEVVD